MEVLLVFAFDRAEIEAVARRIVDPRKAFNLREGWRPPDDRVPRRLLEKPILDGPVAGTRLLADRLTKVIRSYNEARGWDTHGVPSPARLAGLARELGLEDLAIPTDVLRRAEDTDRR